MCDVWNTQKGLRTRARDGKSMLLYQSPLTAAHPYQLIKCGTQDKTYLPLCQAALNDTWFHKMLLGQKRKGLMIENSKQCCILYSTFRGWHFWSQYFKGLQKSYSKKAFPTLSEIPEGPSECTLQNPHLEPPYPTCMRPFCTHSPFRIGWLYQESALASSVPPTRTSICPGHSMSSGDFCI